MENLNNDNDNNNNDPIQENNRSGFGTGQVNQGQNVGQTQQYNNYEQNYNQANTNKKKSKAPIIIIIVIIVVLLLGCCGTGVFLIGSQIYNNANNAINSINNTNYNRINVNNINNQINSINNRINLNTINNSINNTMNSINNTMNSINNTVNKIQNTTVVNNTVSNNAVVNNTVANTTTPNNGNVDLGDAKTSTKEAPLNKGEWGVASKYTTKTSGYSPVKVKVTNYVRGEEAQKIVDEYKKNNKSIYKLETPNAGLEWLVVDYDVDFSTYEMSTIGANADLSGDVEGLTSSSIKYNGTTYITSTIYIGSRDYVKTNNASGRLLTQVPVGCKDYVVKFGAYKETNAFFKGE